MYLFDIYCAILISFHLKDALSGMITNPHSLFFDSPFAGELPRTIPSSCFHYERLNGWRQVRFYAPIPF